MMHKPHNFCSAILLCITVASLRADQQGEFSIDETLKNAAFNTQHMPPEQLLVSRYGKGKTYIRPGRIYHVYYLPDLHLWLRCQGDAEDRLYTPIFEIMISKIDLTTKLPAKTLVIDPNLRGIRIGDDIQRALDQWGDPLRQYAAKIGGVRTRAYEFFPAALGAGLCVRFFARNGKIVAFSFSSDE
jgi:hypothetical protein